MPGDPRAEAMQAGSHAPSQAGGPLVLPAGGLFLWTAIAVSLPVAAGLLVLAAPRLGQLLFMTPAVFATTHAFTLGFGSLAVIGASYQMSTTLVGARLWGERWVPWQFAAFMAGVASIVTGFWKSSVTLLVAGGTLVTLASFAFVAIMIRTSFTIRRTARAGQGGRQVAHGVAMASGVISFGLVTAWGVVLALALRYPFWPGLYQGYRGLLLHLALGFAGWFGLMVIGVSYRLVPILHGARIASERRGLAITALVAAAIVLVTLAVLAGPAWLLRPAVLMLALAGLLHAWEIIRLLGHRRRRAPDLNVDHWWAVLGYTGLLGAIGAGWALGLVRTSPPERLGGAAALLFLPGWVTQAILGQIYKVTPFLMWYYRAAIVDVLEIPRLPRLYSPAAGRATLWLTNAGVLLMSAGILGDRPALVQPGAFLFLVGAVIVAVLLGYYWVPAVLSGRLRFGRRPAGERRG